MVAVLVERRVRRLGVDGLLDAEVDAGGLPVVLLEDDPRRDHVLAAGEREDRVGLVPGVRALRGGRRLRKVGDARGADDHGELIVGVGEDDLADLARVRGPLLEEVVRDALVFAPSLDEVEVGLEVLDDVLALHVVVGIRADLEGDSAREVVLLRGLADLALDHLGRLHLLVDLALVAEGHAPEFGDEHRAVEAPPVARAVLLEAGEDPVDLEGLVSDAAAGEGHRLAEAEPDARAEDRVEVEVDALRREVEVEPEALGDALDAREREDLERVLGERLAVEFERPFEFGHIASKDRDRRGGTV